MTRLMSWRWQDLEVSRDKALVTYLWLQGGVPAHIEQYFKRRCGDDICCGTIRSTDGEQREYACIDDDAIHWMPTDFVLVLEKDDVLEEMWRQLGEPSEFDVVSGSGFWRAKRQPAGGFTFSEIRRLSASIRVDITAVGRRIDMVALPLADGGYELVDLRGR